MTELPDGWARVALEDLAEPERGSITDGPFGSNLTSAHYTEDGPRVVRLQNIGDGTFRHADAHISPEHFASLRKHEVRAGDLLVASLGDNLPRACLAPDDLGPAIVKADCIRVRLGPQADARWVTYAMQLPATRRWATDRLHGVGRQRLGLKLIRQIPVVLPPLAEQHRIVEILEGHLSRLDAADASIRLGVRRAPSMVDASAIGLLIPRLGSSGVESVANDVLPDLPPGWRWSTLGAESEVVGGVTKDTKKQSDPNLPSVPYLRVANVQRATLDLTHVHEIRVPAARAEQLRLRSGDVLLNEGGDRDKLARGWVWEGQIENCIHQNHVFRARPHDTVLPIWLAWCANTYGTRWAQRHGRQSVNLASISLSTIRQLPIPVAPLDHQSQAVARIEAARSRAMDLVQSAGVVAARSTALRRGLLDAAFSGRLTGHDSDLDRAEEAITA
ncbi:restriction endonuclease subunit S [Serinibacter arcticus]|uniref:Restriction endonuclease subunit S n=1 Tax=Serinibacter arcticus TaxID=1655435 RepID=A0A2U1ZXZ0_9MICO|nr:restriction endonuclease subunit S [Serinibacter arcticus]PWD51856.1 restriction endonuclease subunit S [Serinibacter arcticus]